MTTPRHPRRYLFVAPPFVAHVNPMASVGHELTRRGHEVAWVGYARTRALLPANATFFAVAEDEAFAKIMVDSETHATRFVAEGFMFFFRDIVAPLARAMQPMVDAAATAFAPDVVVADQHAWAGCIAARKRNIPWATSASSGQLLVPADTVPQGTKWLESLLADLQWGAVSAPGQWPDVSPHLVLLYTSRAFAGVGLSFPAHYRFVGPAFEHRQDTTEFPWHDLADTPRVLVSLGSIVGLRGERFLQTVVGALAGEPVQVIGSFPGGVRASVPSNFIVRPWLPQVRLLPKMHAVITHGGSTVNEALAFGLPLVVAPVTNDNFIHARKVVEAGAGVRVKFGRPTPDALRRAVFDVLDNPAYRRAAGVIQDSFRAAGGAAAAADAIEAVVR